MAIQNILEHNAENQEIVRDMTAIGAQQHSVLSELGLKVELDQESKPKIHRIT